MKKILFLCLIAFLAKAQSKAPFETVRTQNGAVSGIYSNGVNVFKGIPFAAPPIGELRWKAPQPVANWQGVRKCDTFSASAMQASQPLALLAERLRESKRRFDCIAPVLPDALAGQTQPGPVDEHGWTLLAANAAVAAKLRQLVPLFAARLAERGFEELQLRVKVQNQRV